MMFINPTYEIKLFAELCRRKKSYEEHSILNFLKLFLYWQIFSLFAIGDCLIKTQFQIFIYIYTKILTLSYPSSHWILSQLKFVSFLSIYTILYKCMRGLRKVMQIYIIKPSMKFNLFGLKQNYILICILFWVVKYTCYRRPSEIYAPWSTMRKMWTWNQSSWGDVTWQIVLCKAKP